MLFKLCTRLPAGFQIFWGSDSLNSLSRLGLCPQFSGNLRHRFRLCPHFPSKILTWLRLGNSPMAFAISNFFGVIPRTPIRLMGSEDDGGVGWVWGPTIASSLGPQNTLIRLWAVEQRSGFYWVWKAKWYERESVRRPKSKGTGKVTEISVVTGEWKLNAVIPNREVLWCIWR